MVAIPNGYDYGYSCAGTCSMARMTMKNGHIISVTLSVDRNGYITKYKPLVTIHRPNGIIIYRVDHYDAFDVAEKIITNPPTDKVSGSWLRAYNIIVPGATVR